MSPVMVVLGAILLPGCRHLPEQESAGSSSFKFVDQPVGPPPESKGEVIVPDSRSNYYEAQLHDPAAMPIYPEQARKARTGVSVVGVHITIDPEGRVSGIRSSLLVFNTPGRFSDDFRDAVETAVRQWRFTPARAEYFELVHEGPATSMRTTRVEQVETEFDLSFTFTATGRVQFSPNGR